MCRRAGRDPAGDSQRHPLGGTPATAVTGEALVVRRGPDLEALRRDLQGVLDAGDRAGGGCGGSGCDLCGLEVGMELSGGLGRDACSRVWPGAKVCAQWARASLAYQTTNVTQCCAASRMRWANLTPARAPVQA